MNLKQTDAKGTFYSLKAMFPAGLGEWWASSWAQHHGTEHFHPEGPKAHRLRAPDQSTLHPSLHFLQKGSIIIYLHNCNLHVASYVYSFYHRKYKSAFVAYCFVNKIGVWLKKRKECETCNFEKFKTVIINNAVLVFASIRLVFSNARGRAQSAVMPALPQIQTPTMRMISAVQRRIAVKVLNHSGFKQLYHHFRKPP